MTLLTMFENADGFAGLVGVVVFVGLIYAWDKGMRW